MMIVEVAYDSLQIWSVCMCMCYTSTDEDVTYWYFECKMSKWVMPEEEERLGL